MLSVNRTSWNSYFLTQINHIIFFTIISFPFNTVYHSLLLQSLYHEYIVLQLPTITIIQLPFQRLYLFHLCIFSNSLRLRNCLLNLVSELNSLSFLPNLFSLEPRYYSVKLIRNLNSFFQSHPKSCLVAVLLITIFMPRLHRYVSFRCTLFLNCV